MNLRTKFNKTPAALKFAMVGGIGFLVDLSSLLILYDIMQLELMQARVVAFIMAASSNWFLNRVLTFSFRDLSGKKHHEWLRFLISAGISAVPNLGAFYILMLFLPQSQPFILFAMCCGILLGYYSNYRLASSWVYREMSS